MAVDWGKRWNDLNARQQTYLKIIYEHDQRKEHYYKHDWQVHLQGYPPKASVWRWIYYDNPHGLGDTKLKRELRENDLVSQGTGATFEALANKGYIKRRYTHDGLVLSVQITRKGRQLVRKALSLSAPPKAEKGLLREWHWQALTKLYQAGEEGLSTYAGGEYGGTGWGTWLRLRDYNPPLMREATEANYLTTGRYRIAITEEGKAFFEQNKEKYEQLYGDDENDRRGKSKNRG